ncbi:DUF2635 domain-containing protein [Oceanibacterium hippocampi]|uniref:Uncharacterized protein n=1 Tax=Oceanibacterium hippocampi TaxID=745714 RepID=A0A1Y5U3J1_9PROT|nr:DUF2635 domain-containing protein [Oceanibacterium hippocampi]SLN77595.1 hypothetical protein OCH7691_04474 [Oceanibacterium hippocampi]
MIIVKPAPGRLVRRARPPHRPIEAGDRVDRDSYVERRLAAGDLIEMARPPRRTSTSQGDK